MDQKHQILDLQKQLNSIKSMGFDDSHLNALQQLKTETQSQLSEGREMLLQCSKYAEEFEEQKEIIEQANHKITYVRNRARTLANVESVVEDALKDVLEMQKLRMETEKRLKAIKRDAKQIKVANQNMDRLEKIFTGIEDRYVELKSSEKLLKNAKTISQDLSLLDNQLLEREKSFRQNFHMVDEAIEKTQDARDQVLHIEALVKKLSQEHSQVESTKSLLIDYDKNLQQTSEKISQIRAELTLLDSLEQKSQSLDDTLKALTSQLQKSQQKQTAVDKALQKEETWSKKFSLFQASIEEIEKRQKDVLRVQELSTNLTESLPALEHKLERFQHQQEDIHELSSKFEMMEQHSEVLTQKARETEEHIDILQKAEADLKKLESSHQSVEEKIASQNVALDKLNSRFEAVQNLNDSLTLKLKHIEQHESHADNISAKVKHLEKMDTLVEDKLRRMQNRSDELQKQHTLLIEQGNEFKQMLQSFPDDIVAFQDQFHDIENQRQHFLEKWESLNKTSQQELKQLEGHAQSVQTLNTKLETAQGTFEKLDTQMLSMQERRSTMEHLSGKVESVDSSVSKLSSQMKALSQEAKIVNETKAALNEINEMYQNSHQNIIDLNKQQEGLQKKSLNLEKVNDSFGQLELRMKEFVSYKETIRDAEKRMDKLQNMMEDIKTESIGIHQEQEHINTAVEKITQLEYLLGQADVKLEEMRKTNES